MPSLREIRRKIKSVKSTQQITKAMKMVAAARMRRAQQAILASRPFAVRMQDAVRDLAILEMANARARGIAEGDPVSKREGCGHPFFETRPKGPACLVVVSADKGLCGAFNANVLRAALDWLRRRREEKVLMALVGRKARDMVYRLRDFHPAILTELVGIFPKVNYAHAELLGKTIIDAYRENKCASVDVIYNEFKSVAVQRVLQAQLLPIPIPQISEGGGPGTTQYAARFKFEPRREELLGALLPRYIKAQLLRILLESQAAELSARMNAMDSASKNAGELIDTLTLRLNRTRQGIITGEIAELVGGAEALAA